jgi:hypothetical protein
MRRLIHSCGFVGGLAAAPAALLFPGAALAAPLLELDCAVEGGYSTDHIWVNYDRGEVLWMQTQGPATPNPGQVLQQAPGGNVQITNEYISFRAAGGTFAVSRITGAYTRTFFYVDKGTCTPGTMPPPAQPQPKF